MQNYFSDTPIYKIWISVIDTLIPRSEFIISEFNFQFRDIVCNREGIVIVYIKKNFKLELVYAHEYRSFFCRLIDIETNLSYAWRNTPPAEKKNYETLSELEIEIDKWMSFLLTEL
jgi:hypothetical protein